MRDVAAELLYRYAELIDAGDFEGLADLLADATLTTEGLDVRSEGRDEILATYVDWTRRYEDGTPKTKHVITNVIIESAEPPEAPTAATSRAYFTVLQAVPGELALQPIVAGRYRHAFAPRDGRWRIVGMHIVLDLIGDLSHHGVTPLEPEHP